MLRFLPSRQMLWGFRRASASRRATGAAAAALASVLCAVLGAYAGEARAAVTFGADLSQASAPAFDCAASSRPCTWLQSEPAEGEAVTAPFAGTIVSWAIGKAHSSDKFALRLARVVGSPSPLGEALWTGAGTSAVITVPSPSGNMNGPFATDLAVQAGDEIGIQSEVGNAGLVPAISGVSCATKPITPLVSYFTGPDLEEGAPGRPVSGFETICAEPAVQATIAALPSSSATAGCPLAVHLSSDPVTIPRAVRYTLDGGAVQSAAASGESAVLAVPGGSHVVSFWAEDALGAQETAHHAITFGPPQVTISSDQGRSTYEVGEAATASVAASAAGGVLVSDPSASRVPLATSAPGHYTLARSAADDCGNSATATFSYTVLALPSISALRASPAAFHARRGKHRTSAGTTIRYLDSSRASTTIALTQPTPGVRRGSRCVPARSRSASRSRRRCSLTRTLLTLTHLDAAGANTVSISAAAAHRPLPPGAYTLSLTPRDGAGVAGAVARVSLRVLPGS
jgi:hypothetical protein